MTCRAYSKLWWAALFSHTVPRTQACRCSPSAEDARNFSGASDGPRGETESTDIRDSPTHGPGWSSHWEANSQQQLPTPVQDIQSAFYFFSHLPLPLPSSDKLGPVCLSASGWHSFWALDLSSLVFPVRISWTSSCQIIDPSNQHWNPVWSPPSCRTPSSVPHCLQSPTPSLLALTAKLPHLPLTSQPIQDCLMPHNFTKSALPRRAWKLLKATETSQSSPWHDSSIHPVLTTTFLKYSLPLISMASCSPDLSPTSLTTSQLLLLPCPPLLNL